MGITEAELAMWMQNQRIAQGKPANPKRPKSSMSEADLERIGTQILIADGWRALKTNPVSRRARGAGFGELGMADYLYMRYDFPDISDMLDALFGDEVITQNEVTALSQVLWIEWKRDGGQAQEHQRAWHAIERGRGALVWVAGEDFTATPEEFEKFYRNSGLYRGPQ